MCGNIETNLLIIPRRLIGSELPEMGEKTNDANALEKIIKVRSEMKRN